ncbi:MAG TPA: Gmad2 immunoglobulin-like domain-containing protein [Candidatus Paceibacterota bacterium]|jgi:hypothetical protein|nr:Gmad2 immunoglobulin-like domain-containing protein [Candidatus Paceibacterota bacterium]
MNKKALVAIIAVFAAFGGLLLWGLGITPSEHILANISSFEDCVSAGLDSTGTPPSCATPDGRTFAKLGAPPAPPQEATSTDIATDTAPTIAVDAPQPDDAVVSPLRVSGKARGWYFEATFPVRLLDSKGRTVAVGAAVASGDWTSRTEVPFTARLTFSAPSTETGTLVLERSNSSGLPDQSAEVSIPVRFSTVAGEATSTATTSSGEGAATGSPAETR